MNKIPAGMVQTAFENRAKVEWMSNGSWVTKKFSQSPLSMNGCKHRIGSLTADGLRLDELLDKAKWDLTKLDLILVPSRKNNDSIPEFLSMICWNPVLISKLSLKAPEKKYRDMGPEDLAMLPRGTAFIDKQTGHKHYNLRIEQTVHGVANNKWWVVYGRSLMSVGVSDFTGYILPNEQSLQSFKVPIPENDDETNYNPC